MLIGAEALNAALADFKTLDYQSQVAAAYEAFLTAKSLAGSGGGAPTFSTVGGAVPALFGVLPQHDLGRLAPFKYDWLTIKDTGRKTVWNNNSRVGNRKSQTLFVDNDIRNGLKPDAAELLGAMLPARKPSRQSLAAVFLRDHDFADTDSWAEAEAKLKSTLSLSDDELAHITAAGSLGVRLLSDPAWSADTLNDDLRPPEAVVVQKPPTSPAHVISAPPDQEQLAVAVDSRVERMLRLALTAYSSVLLVGPPGTGKGTLLRWIFDRIAADPTAYGFDVGFAPKPLWRTPDESWSAFELIGGLAPDKDGALSWSPGAMLNAIAEDRWLILDETNRADMDKIMGPLLTWLSKQEVEIGRSAAHNGDAIRIGWATTQQSDVPRDPGGDGTRYLAGTAWRLIGTFNPQDAQRVFRFGQALSRRFVAVPVPAVRPGQFEQLLGAAYPGLTDEAARAIVGLYTAHLGDEQPRWVQRSSSAWPGTSSQACRLRSNKRRRTQRIARRMRTKGKPPTMSRTTDY